MQAVMEVLNKSHYGNSHLQMRRNPSTIAEHSGHYLFFTFRSSSTTTKPLHYRFLEDLKKWPLFPGLRLKDAPLPPEVASDLQGVQFVSEYFRAGTCSGPSNPRCRQAGVQGWLETQTD